MAKHIQMASSAAHGSLGVTLNLPSTMKKTFSEEEANLFQSRISKIRTDPQKLEPRFWLSVTRRPVHPARSRGGGESLIIWLSVGRRSVNTLPVA